MQYHIPVKAITGSYTGDDGIENVVLRLTL